MKTAPSSMKQSIIKDKTKGCGSVSWRHEISDNSNQFKLFDCLMNLARYDGSLSLANNHAKTKKSRK